MTSHESDNDDDGDVMFVGQGPAFKKSFYEKESFYTIVDMYLLMCSILELKPDGLWNVESNQIERMLVMSYRKYIPRNYFNYSIFYSI